MNWLNRVGFASPPPAASATNSRDKMLEENQIIQMNREVRRLNARIDNLKSSISRELCNVCNFEWMTSLHTSCPSCFIVSQNYEFDDRLGPWNVSEVAPGEAGGARQGDLDGGSL